MRKIMLTLMVSTVLSGMWLTIFSVYHGEYLFALLFGICTYLALDCTHDLYKNKNY